MSNKSKHPRPKMHTCADCGNDKAVVRVTGWPNESWICLQCQRDRNDKLTEFVREGASVMQPIDPDSPPMPCGCGDCTADATYIVKVNSQHAEGYTGNDDVVGLTACDEHIPDMTNVFAEMIGKPVQVVNIDKPRYGPELHRQTVGFMLDMQPGEDLVTAIKRQRQCPDCDGTVELEDDGIHVIHRPTCPRLKSWQ